MAVSGDARMGITYNSEPNAALAATAPQNNKEFQFTNRVRVTFTLSGETDTGLAFGGSFRADNAGAAAAGTGGSVFVSGEFGKLSMGDVDTAFGAVFGDIGGVGLTGLGFLNELSHSADGGLFGTPLTPAAAALLGTNAASTTTLGLDTGWDYNSLRLSDGTDVSVAPTLAALQARQERLETVFGGLFDRTFVVGDGTSADSYGGAIVEGFVAGIGAANLTDGMQPGTTATGGLFVFQPGTLLGEAYLAAAARAGVHSAAGSGTFDAVGNNADVIIDASIAVNMPTVAARALYEYSIEGFSFALGGSQSGNATAYSVAAAYEMEGFKLAAGYARTDWKDAVIASVSATGIAEYEDGEAASLKTNTFTNTHDAKATEWNVGASYTMDELTLAAVYQQKTMRAGGLGLIDRHTTMGASASFTMDAITVSAFGNQVKSKEAGTINNFGIGASYDLGGGASMTGGVVSAGNFHGSSTTTADLGLAFSF